MGRYGQLRTMSREALLVRTHQVAILTVQSRDKSLAMPALLSKPNNGTVLPHKTSYDATSPRFLFIPSSIGTILYE